MISTERFRRSFKTAGENAMLEDFASMEAFPLPTVVFARERLSVELTFALDDMIDDFERGMSVFRK